jgi:hypothetical protein
MPLVEIPIAARDLAVEAGLWRSVCQKGLAKASGDAAVAVARFDYAYAFAFESGVMAALHALLPSEVVGLIICERDDAVGTS